jgi:tetratricopeptide (TPR) repeat protein
VINSLEQMFSAALEKSARSHDVTKALFLEISDEARKHQVPMVVAGMSPYPDTADILKFCAQGNIPVANISCDWQLPAAFNAPADPFHPSPLGYRTMAERLDAFLKLQFWQDDFRREVANPAASTEAHEALGRAAQAAGKFDEAAAELQAAIALAPQQPLLHSYLGGLHLQAGRPQEAIAEFERELAIQPDHFESTAQLASALQSLGENDRAIERYREALKLCAFWSTGHNNLGSLLSAKGKLDEAAAEFTEALRYQPDFFEASAQLALCLAGLRHDPSAVKQFQAALKLRPDWREGRRQLAWILATSYAPDVHNVEQSLALAQQLCQETQYSDPPSLEALAAALAASGDFENAVRWQSKALDGMPAESPARAAARQRFERYSQQKPWRE